ncbi:hypothetical protein DEJ47_32550 [Streptomyces venezuelae]|uniref:Aspartate/ornithine carbamoyltransferase Asp/Orn-binding domain-containing protein n=1 Tax=Streptomyces venezuelae TaxID=54571 RepID=A0A5P2BQ88_STRVZ|nr:hypothetical protein DEJ47_32550 [Streptomyces venezuelae]
MPNRPRPCRPRLASASRTEPPAPWRRPGPAPRPRRTIQAPPPPSALPVRLRTYQNFSRQHPAGHPVPPHSRPDSARSLPAGVDVVYTSRCGAPGTAVNDAAWRERFRAFHVDEEFMTRRPCVLLLHDPPARRGDEVSGTVLDGPRSVAWTRSAMKFSGATAVLVRFVGSQAPETPAPPETPAVSGPSDA